MRILVLDNNYPSDDNLYGDVFVHVRVARYVALGHDVKVIAFFRDAPSYVFDGIAVDWAPDIDSLRAQIAAFAPDVVVIHFFQGWMLRKLVLASAQPVVVWVHGFEALWWVRRLFDASPTRQFAQYVFYNTIQMVRMRKLFRYATAHPRRVRFVFVSDWMRRIAETDTATRLCEYAIIPNPIDTTRFPYVDKAPELRRHVLLIRSFDSRKYANDLAIAAIERLSTEPEFARMTFTVCGRGKLFAKLTDRLRRFPNVTLREGFLRQADIRALHATHGVLLSPTRQDAQGVSMCEAMSSGLVPVTSASTAVPEFITHGHSGFLTRSAAELAAAMLTLQREPERFVAMSNAAASSIRQKAAIDHVVDQEVRYLRRAVGQ